MKNAAPVMMLHIAPRQSAANTFDMYLYDDVSARGKFDWSTWTELKSETSANYFREQLAQIPQTATINLYINSNGGDVKEGVGIYNQLKRHGATINGVVDGNAYSVAFLILMACNKRIMNLGTSALVHNMWTIVAGNARELRQEADNLDKLMESNRQIFLEACNHKLTEKELIKLMDAETYLTPDECLEYGFIDEVNRQADPDDEDEDPDDTDTDLTVDPDPDDGDDTDPDDPDDDDQQAVKQLRRMEQELNALRSKLNHKEPMHADRVNNLVSKYFK